MSPTAFDQAADLTELVEPACALAHRWLAATQEETSLAERRSAAQLAGLVRDREGLDLAVRFVDRVARPESLTVAARELARLRGDSESFLSPLDRSLLWLGSRVAPLAPRLVVGLARQRLRQLLGHLVIDDDHATLTRHLRAAEQDGFRLNLNLLGEAVLGEREAQSRLERTQALLLRPDVDYVSIKISALASQISAWDVPGTVERVAERLRGLFRAAAAKNAFVNLDMEEYKDLDLTVEVFTTLLAEPEFLRMSAGLALQAYLPDSSAALERLVEFAQERQAAGGAPIKVRLVKGANLAMERVEAELHGWAQAPYPSKEETDALYLTLIDRAVSAEHGTGLRVGVASHNLFDIALAYLLARGRGVADRVDIEMLQGMAPAKARAVRDSVGTVILYTPVVARAHFDVAVAYLIRRLEENAAPENFLHALFAGGIPAQEQRFRRSVAEMARVSTDRRRSSERPPAPAGFANTTDSDPALAEVREWAAACVSARPGPLRSPRLADAAAVDDVVRRGRAAGEAWGRRTPEDRAVLLRRAADEIEARRGELVTAMAHEGGKTIGEADPEVSEAVDFARWYADRAAELATEPLLTDGVAFTPHGLTLVTPPWNFPVSIPAGGILAALAAGSAVVVKPAGAVPRCTEILVEAIHAAGVPQDVAQVVRLASRELGPTLVAHEGVDGVVLTGSADTAALFIRWRSGRPGGHGVFAETSGKNALIITEAADYDLAVADLVRSAFGHAGQKCSAASLAILVGEVGHSARFRNQLVDAVTSLRVGWPTDLGATMGPVIEPPGEKLRRGLTRLDPGEKWLIQPRSLDGSDRLWSPGVRDGVLPGSWFHQTECFGPVLGIMRARNLDEAIRWQNQVAYGLTGGLHSLDADEIDEWLARVEVGNAYVNRHITGAIVQRQPFGGWKASVVGPGAKAGGPDYVAQLGTWTETGLPARGREPDESMASLLGDFRSLLTVAAERDWLSAAARSDTLVWDEVLGKPTDATGLRAESNVLRHVPAPLILRGLAGARLVEVLRVMLAARRVGASLQVSLAEEEYAAAILRTSWPSEVRVESDAEFGERFRGERVRVVGPGSWTVADALTAPGRTALGGPVLANGRRELLGVVREQAVSRTLHRYGHLPPAG